MKITLEIERYELTALMEFHRDAEIEAANRCEYQDADQHMARLQELIKFWNAPATEPEGK